MSSIAVQSSTEYMPNFGGNTIMEEIYKLKMKELKLLGAPRFKQNIITKLVLVVEQIVSTLYDQLHGLTSEAIARSITKDFQLFSWFASEWERHGESTGKALPKQPHFFVKALVNPEIGLFKYGDKCYFHRKIVDEWKQNVYFIHTWEQQATDYSAAVASKRKNLTEVWTNRKSLCLYSRDKKFTAFPRGKYIDFDWGYEADKVQGEPAFTYILKGTQKTYKNTFGYKLEWFDDPFDRLLMTHKEWHNIDKIELQNILTETLILFHELIHVVTNTARQAENQNPDDELWPAMPEDYPVEEFTVDDWPVMGKKAGEEYMAALGGKKTEAAKEFLEKGGGEAKVWPFFTDGSGHGVEFCNMYSLFAGMRGQTTLCKVAYEKRKTRIELQKKLPGGLKRDQDSDGSGKKPPPHKEGSKPKKKYVPKQEKDGTTTWVQELYVKLKF